MIKRGRKYLFLLGLVLGTSFIETAFATNQEETIFSITLNSSLNLSISSSALDLPITPNANGTYGSAYFTVSSGTNNLYGYTITMSTEDDHTYLESTTENVVTGEKPRINTLTVSQEGISAEAFASATTEAGGLNKWGIALDSGNYNAVTSPMEIKKTNTNNTGVIDSTTINIAAKLNLDVPAGVYKNKFNFQMVANPMPVTLETAYSNAGKTKKTVGNSSYYSMQDMTPAICNAVTIPQETEVVDERDGTIYRINKLADDRCWMLDNLALDITDPTVQSNMDTSNTNANQTSLISLFSGNRANGGQYAFRGATTDWTVWCNEDDDDCLLYDYSFSYSDPWVGILDEETAIEGSAGQGSHNDPLADLAATEGWAVGIYYNYCAASAGSYCYGEGREYSAAGSIAADKTNSAIDAEFDICPSGWRMPTGGSYDSTNRSDGGEIQTLHDAYSGDAISLRRAMHLSLSGWFWDWMVFNMGYSYDLWTSTYANDHGMYTLRAEETTASPQNTTDRSIAVFMRCVVKTGTEPASSGN